MKGLRAKIIGKQIPKGKVKVSGAKNSATRLLAASMISDGVVQLNNFPVELVDANHKLNFLRKQGAKVHVDHKKEVISIDHSSLKNTLLEDYNYPIRTTYLLVPGLIKKSGVAYIPYPGGCKIGNRGYDLHIMVWEQMGAEVIEHSEYIEVSTSQGLKGTVIDFPITTIGGTESALICGAIAQGKTVIKNAYISPEVNDLISFLRLMGVSIKTVGKSYIEIEGRSQHLGVNYQVLPDRIEALTWLVFGAISGGEIIVEDVPFDVMQIPLKHIKEAGVDFYRNAKNIIISPDCLQTGAIQPFELATGTHPGVISDMQPFYVLLGLYAAGKSRIYDYRYPERIKYCDELAKLYRGAIQSSKGEIITSGVAHPQETELELESTDLRGSMAVLMAAILTDGTTIINNVEMALRGYNKLSDKLEQLGINISLFEDEN